MKSTNLREMEGMIGIDLVEAALAHRQFLGLVDENPCLYTGPHVENAVRRYASVFRIESKLRTRINTYEWQKTSCSKTQA